MITTFDNQSTDIRALDDAELDAVNGGVAPLLLIAAAAGGAAAGTAAAIGIWKLAQWVVS
ncbi:MAG: class IIb bacteriocin, lactobin A/cerein 7B family [Hyphomicrobiaceae bacterium]